MGAGRTADRADAAVPVNGVGGVLHDGHRFRVEIDALGIAVLALTDDSPVFLRKVIDGIAVRVAVGKPIRQHILQPSDQYRVSEARSGVINAVGVRVGDEDAAIDLHLVST